MIRAYIGGAMSMFPLVWAGIAAASHWNIYIVVSLILAGAITCLSGLIALQRDEGGN